MDEPIRKRDDSMQHSSIRLETYLGRDKEWWLKQVRCYNEVHGSSISEALVEEFFDSHDASEGCTMHVQHQLFTVWSFAVDPAYAHRRE